MLVVPTVVLKRLVGTGLIPPALNEGIGRLPDAIHGLTFYKKGLGMTINYKKIVKNLCIFALIVGAIWFISEATDAWAQGSIYDQAFRIGATGTGGTTGGFFSDAAKRFMNTFQSVRTMVLIFGGFGLVVLAVAAIMGKIKWAALGALAAGLAIVAVAGKVVDYATTGSKTEVQDFSSTNMNM